MQAQQAAGQQVVLCTARACGALPSSKQTIGGKPLLTRQTRARQQHAAPRSRSAASQRVQAIVAEPPVLETAPTFPRGAHWQVRAAGGCSAAAAASSACRLLLPMPAAVIDYYVWISVAT